MVLEEEITPGVSTRGFLFFPKLNLIYLAAKNKGVPISSFLFLFHSYHLVEPNGFS